MTVRDPDAPVTVADLEELKARLDAFEATTSDVAQLKGWRKQLESDEAFGRVLSGPQWLGGASIMDGTVDGNVFRSQVTVANLFTTADSPADRWELDSTSLRAYGTVLGSANTKTFEVTAAGDVTIGAAGGNQLTYVASTRTLSAPAAIFGTITIASITSGTMAAGTTYLTNAGYPRIDLATTGIKSYNSSGTPSFVLSTVTGNMTVTGTFQLASSTSAPNRLELDQDGIRLWKLGTREFLLQTGGSSSSVSMLLTGPSAGQYIGLDPSSGLWLGSSTITSAPFRVTPAGLATLTGATLQSNAGSTRVELTASGLKAYSAGTETVNISGSSSTITAALIRTASTGARVELDSTGIYQYNGGGTPVGQMKSDGTGFLGASSGQISWSAGSVSISASRLTSGTVGSGGSLALGTLSVSGTITIGSGGSITNSDGDTWNQTGLTLISSGVFGDSIIWKNSGVTVAGIYSTSSEAWFSAGALGATSSGYHSVSASAAKMGLGFSGPSLQVGTGGFNLIGSPAYIGLPGGTFGRLYFNYTPSLGGTMYLTQSADLAYLQAQGTKSLYVSGDASYPILNLGTTAYAAPTVSWTNWKGSSAGATAANGYCRIIIAGVTYRIPLTTDA